MVDYGNFLISIFNEKPEKDMSEKEYLSNLGKRVALARKSKGLSQEQLAEFAGVSVKVVQKLETGGNATRSYNLARIIEVLGEDASYILFGDIKLDVSHGIYAKYNKRLGRLSSEQSLLFCSVVDTFFKALETENPFTDTE